MSCEEKGRIEGKTKKNGVVFLGCLFSLSLSLFRALALFPRVVFFRELLFVTRGFLKRNRQKVRGNRKSSSQKLPLSDPSLPLVPLSFVSLFSLSTLSLSPHTLSAILYLSRSRERGAEKRPEICS